MEVLFEIVPGIGDCFADSLPPEGRWPELLQALFVASQSHDVGQRQSAFRIFTATPGIIEQQHENVVIGAFTKGFKDDDVSVRFPDFYGTV